MMAGFIISLSAFFFGSKSLRVFVFLSLQKIHLLWGGDDIIFNMEEARNLKEYVLFTISINGFDLLFVFTF